MSAAATQRSSKALGGDSCVGFAGHNLLANWADEVDHDTQRLVDKHCDRHDIEECGVQYWLFEFMHRPGTHSRSTRYHGCVRCHLEMAPLSYDRQCCTVKSNQPACRIFVNLCNRCKQMSIAVCLSAYQHASCDNKINITRVKEIGLLASLS